MFTLRAVVPNITHDHYVNEVASLVLPLDGAMVDPAEGDSSELLVERR